MADIDITLQHHLSPAQARAAAQQVADRLAESYDLTCRWEDGVLRFERSGVQGSLTVRETEAQVQIALGMLFGAFAEPIREKVQASMQKVFGA
jgi:putative polyhydroxyalkanoate system protein